jgi:hypothetical protein
MPQAENIMTDRISQFPNVDHFAFNERSDHTVAEQYIEQIEGEAQIDACVKCSGIELAPVAGASRPLVEHFARIARDACLR